MKQFLISLLIMMTLLTSAQQKPLSQQLAERIIHIPKDSFSLDGKAQWTPYTSIVVKGMEGIWRNTGDASYYNYILQQIDGAIQTDGTIKTQPHSEYNLEDLNYGSLTLLQYKVTQQEKYLKAVKLLRERLPLQQINWKDSRWHNKDDLLLSLRSLFIAAPFYTEYADLMHEHTSFDAVADQLIDLEKHLSDIKKNLFKTADVIAWYASSLVEVLDWFPPEHPKRKELIGILNRLTNERSMSSLLVYAIAKSVRIGYLPATKLTVAKKGYNDIAKQFTKITGRQINLRDRLTPDVLGALLLASNEMEILSSQSIGKGKTVLLDRYFNSEKKKDAAGVLNYWHYTWKEQSNGGFAGLGHIFNMNGSKLASLDIAPIADNLKKASIYIIVDPDHIKDNPTPNYISNNDVKPISDWVKAGGVLVLMANDSANCDLEHFNKLANTFGITFTNKSINMVKNDAFETGVVIPNDKTIFKEPYKMYLKEICVLDIKAPAKAMATKDADVIIATAKYGKGTVFAVGDPWLYNEYLDGRKLPLQYPNFRAAEDLVHWLLTSSNR